MESLEQYKVEKIAQALGHAACIRIVALLGRHAQWMGQAHIGMCLQLDEPTVAQRLQQLHDCGLLESMRGRYYTQYRLSHNTLDGYLVYLERFACVL